MEVICLEMARRAATGYKTYQVFDPAIADVLKGLRPYRFGSTAQEVETATKPAAGVNEGGEAVRVELDLSDLSVSGNFVCNVCTLEFPGSSEQREHFKGDWHHFNLKRSLRQQPLVTEEEFERIIEEDDLSSLSGSDSDESEPEGPHPAAPAAAPGHRQPKVYLVNGDGTVLSLYRALLTDGKDEEASEEELAGRAEAVGKGSPQWAVLLTNAGHFAGAVFSGGKVLVHKTFHRYVVRAKGGTAQSTRDAGGRKPKSGGATLRRYNEKALKEDISGVLESWAGELGRCSRIFIRTSVASRPALFGGKTSPLKRGDPRICSVPFPTQRSTFKELQRVHGLLATVETYGEAAALGGCVPASPNKMARLQRLQERQLLRQQHARPCSPPAHGNKASAQAPPSDDGEEDEEGEKKEEGQVELVWETRATPTADLKPFDVAPKPRRRRRRKKGEERPGEGQEIHEEMEDGQEEEDALEPVLQELHDRLYTACKFADLETVTSVLTRQEDEFSKDQAEKRTAKLLNYRFGPDRQTLLHVATDLGHTDMVWCLLEHGADPSIRDGHRKLPYLSTSSREVRNVFRRFMASAPARYDYTAAQVPGPLDEGREEEKRMKEAERRKAAKKAKKEREKSKRAEERVREEEEGERRRYLGLSDREKRALAAEARLVKQMGGGAVLSRCFQCASDMSGKVPFEYMDFRFCTPKCLKEHRMGTKQPS